MLTGMPGALTVAIWGVGLIGGSLGLGWRAATATGDLLGQAAWPDGVGTLRILGVDRADVLSRAVARGAIDAGVSPEEAIAQAQVHVLAAPVGAILDLAEQIGPRLPPGTVVTDVGSTKVEITARWEARLAPRAAFVGGHPLFGREVSGIEAADPALAQGARWFLTPGARATESALALVEGLVRLLGARPIRTTPAEHDAAMAVISHLPQAVASALAASLAGDSALGWAGRGFRDATRLAASPAEIWLDIFRTNRRPLLAALDSFRERLDHLRRAIQEGDEAAIAGLFAQAQEAVRRAGN
jgi:prephenate dehydrogenase